MTAPSILAAKAEAVAARADLDATLAELKVRTAPRHIAETAWSNVRDRGEALADQGAHFAKRRPDAVAGGAALATLFLLRKPLGRAIGRLFSRRRDDDAPPEPDAPLYTAPTLQEETLP